MLAKRDLHLMDGYGFGMLMGTRPQTIGYSLLDSPAGLAAWLGEKFAAYSDGLSVAQRVDNIALYWLTGTGASSSRWYWEAMRWMPRTAEDENAQPVTVPTACSLFPADPWPTARRWAERRYLDLRSWHELDRGGHFPGLEQPDLLVSEIRDAFRALAAQPRGRSAWTVHPGHSPGPARRLPPGNAARSRIPRCPVRYRRHEAVSRHRSAVAELCRAGQRRYRPPRRLRCQVPR
ncbi:hypothetical protein H4W33_002419 [Kibdelosporangium phytohabitans]|nr:hypothetical protein [Kibdelosporangium phytohabitans]